MNEHWELGELREWRKKKSFECKKNMKLKEKKVNYGVDQFSLNEWSLKEENVEGRRWMEKET